MDPSDGDGKNNDLSPSGSNPCSRWAWKQENNKMEIQL
jgi:hypothetical protein